MTNTQELKKPIREWLKKFDDQRLASLLAHAQDGNLAFNSCCCLIGMYNAPLNMAFVADRASNPGWFREPKHQGHPLCHHEHVRELFGAQAQIVENAFRDLAFHPSPLPRGNAEQDARRRRILIPMIRAEMRYRRAPEPVAQPEAEVQHVG